MKQQRNAQCDCGSGKKFKHCCASTHVDQRATSGDAQRLAELIRTGRWEELECAAHELTNHQPTSGVAWQLLGLARSRQGKDALPALLNAAAILTEDAEAQSNVGNALRAAGRLEEALVSHRRALTLKPDYAEAHNNLGTALRERGLQEEAAQSYRSALAINPDFALAHVNLAALLAATGQWEASVAHYRRALAVEPSVAEWHYGLGNALLGQGRPSDAVPNYRRAIEIRPTFIAAHSNMASALRDTGDAAAAAASLRTAVALDPGSAELALNLAVVLRLQGLIEEAESSCARALQLNPRLAAALVMSARLRGDRGEFADAEQWLERAIAVEPTSAEAWSAIPTLRKMTLSDSRWRTEAERLADLHPPPRHEIHLRYAIGKYFDDVKDFPRAFSAYRRANDLSRQIRPPHDRQQLERLVGWIKQQFEGRDFARGIADRFAASQSERPVFIVGMPRAGTTLAEQILASHPLIHGAGELPFWGKVLAECQNAGTEDRHLHRPLASDYLHLLESLAAGAQRVVDKMPSNFLALGLIHAAFPNARIIHMRRDAIDTCLSIYFQDFEAAYSYANDLGDLAHAYAAYHDLMRFWRTALPTMKVLDVSYEDLTREPEKCSRALLNFVGVSWDARCLDFHHTRRAVSTTSSWQVRQAIHTSSVHRWHHYESQIGDLLPLADLDV